MLGKNQTRADDSVHLPKEPPLRSRRSCDYRLRHERDQKKIATRNVHPIRRMRNPNMSPLIVSFSSMVDAFIHCALVVTSLRFDAKLNMKG
jgi:hypothetical protein